MTKGYFQETIKKEFSSLTSLYFNAAYFGPYPLRTQNNIQKMNENFADPSFLPYSEWMHYPDLAREKISQLLECPATNIAHSTSVSGVITTIAHGLKRKKKVVSINGDFPSNIQPWLFAKKANRVDFQILNAPNMIDVDWLEKNLPTDTEILDMSHVSFNTGRKADLVSIGKFLKSRGIRFIVDATQSLGGMKITKKELSYIDVLACSTYKWLLSPYGHAFCYIADDFFPELNSINASWLSNPIFRKSGDILAYTDEELPGATGFDRGQAPNLLLMAGLSGSLELFLELELANIQKHNQLLALHFFNNFKNKDFNIVTPKEGLSNIICLTTKKDLRDLQIALEGKNIDISLRAGNLRISFHLFNTIEQVETLLRALNSSK